MSVGHGSEYLSSQGANFVNRTVFLLKWVLSISLAWQQLQRWWDAGAAHREAMIYAGLLVSKSTVHKTVLSLHTGLPS
jgi:hypothetical protein